VRNGQLETSRVFLLDTVVDLARIARWRLFENRTERRPRVFNVDVNAAGKDGLMADIGPRQIETPVHRQMRLGFEALRE